MKIKNIKSWVFLFFLLFLWYVPRNTAPGGFFENYILLRWSTYLIIPTVSIVFLYLRFYLKPKLKVPSIILPITAVLLIILLSGIINNSSLIAVLFTALTYLRYPLLFILLINLGIDDKVWNLFLKGFFLLLIIQIPEIAYRYFAMGIRWDGISLTMGPWGTFDLGVYMIYATALVAAKSLIVKLNKIHILLIASFFFIALVGEIKVYVFAAPLIAGVVILTHLKSNFLKKKTLITTAVLISILVIALIVIVEKYKKVFPEAIAGQRVMKMAVLQERPSLPGRVSSFIDIIETVQTDKLNFWIGWGPGSSLVGGFLVGEGKIFQFPIQHKNQLGETFVDIGLVGMIAYYWLLIWLFLMYLKHIETEKDIAYIVLNRALIGMWFFYAFLGPWYDLVWRHDSPNFIFYFLSAAVYTRYRKNKNESIAD